jgi:hypothetical protein
VADYRSELIRLYAGNRTSDIRGVPAFQQLCALFGGDPGFQAERDRVEVAKVTLEAALDRAQGQQDAVGKAIQLLVQTRGDDKLRDLCHALIVAGCKPSWTAGQQQYFDDAWGKVRLKYDYFLSFTNRYPGGIAGDNPVNSAYKHFIVSEIGHDEFNATDRKTNNLLAQVAYRLLSQPRLKGFFFPHRQYDNTVTEQKLKEACDDCMVFIQLVQAIMFDPPTHGGTNYCHFEWDRIRARFNGPDSEKHILFVVAAPDRNSFLQVLPFAAYNNWYDHVSRKDPPYLPELPSRNQAKLTQLKDTFTRTIVQDVRAAWFRLINNVP